MTTNIYKNIVLVGATGNVGEHVLSALLTDGTFNVTVLSRANSNAKFPSNVKVIKVDFTDANALLQALANQDVVISTIGGAGVASGVDELLIQASLDAKVKWFFPSEFGINIEHPLADIPLLASKQKVVALLKKNQSRIAYTSVTTGSFLDWGFENGFLGFDIEKHSAVIYDEGKSRTSGITLPLIGKAIVAALRNPEKTLNKRIFVADATFNQQEALALFEKYTKTKWTTKHVTTADTRKDAEEQLAKGNIPQAFRGYLSAFLFGEKEANNFENQLNNKDLGLSTVSLDTIIKEAVERKNSAK